MTSSSPADHPVLVLDLGAQDSQLVARRLREAGAYSELVPARIPADEVRARNARAIVLTSGPFSVAYGPNTGLGALPELDSGILDLGIPVLAIGAAAILLVKNLGGSVEGSRHEEQGLAGVDVQHPASPLLRGLPVHVRVHLSHGGSIAELPAAMTLTASTGDGRVVAFEDVERNLYGVQWLPELRSSEHGGTIFENFVRDIVGLDGSWTASNIVEEQIRLIREQVGQGRVLCALSGGVDSAVAAALVHRAVGDRLTCVFVDHGLLREGEREQVEGDYVASTGVRLITVDARERFLEALAGVTDPESKRKIIGTEFIRVFENTQKQLVADAIAAGDPMRYLVQGTIYPDIVESGAGDGTANIKSHHNVGGLPEDVNFELVEPLRALFKDEVRAVGRELGLPADIVNRQPFPGPGLGIRIIGAITEERLRILRAADAVVRSELTAAGLDSEIWQCPVVLLADVRSVGVANDQRTYGHPIVLRPVWTEDAMTADWVRLPYDVLAHISNEITRRVPEVNRVVLDITPKPPGTIEWE